MDELNTTPVEDSATVDSLPYQGIRGSADAARTTASGEDGHVLSVDGFVDALEAMEMEEDAGVAHQAAAGSEGEADSREQRQPQEVETDYGNTQAEAVDGQPGEDAPAQDEDPAGEPDAPATTGTDAPASWGKEAKELFAKLPAQLQAEVHKRETERERFVNAKAEEAAKAQQREQQLLEYAHTQLQDALVHARAALEGEFSTVDWVGLQQTDPQLYVQLQGLFKQRLAETQAVMEQAGQLEAARAKQEESRLLAEFKEVHLPRFKAMFGDEWEPRKFSRDAQEYLKGLGAPESHIGGISHGYMLELIAKAMKYDGMQSAAAAARQKVAAAPKVLQTRAAVKNDNATDKIRSAAKKLKQNPNSTDAMTAYLESLG